MTSQPKGEWLPAPTFFLSHGTLAGRSIPEMRRFYESFLGLECVRHLSIGMLFRKGGDWVVAAGGIGDKVIPQTRDKRWDIEVSSSLELELAHARALREREQWGLQAVENIEREGESSFFVIRDADGNWWQITARPDKYFDEIFDRGDQFSEAQGGHI